MTKIIPTGVIGWKIIPVGTSMMCMVRMHNLVGVSGNTGRVDFEESCEVVDYQLKSGLEVRGQQNKSARMSVSEGWKLFEKNIPRAASCFWPHEMICGRFRRYCSDVWGYMYQAKERFPKIWMKLWPSAARRSYCGSRRKTERSSSPYAEAYSPRSASTWRKKTTRGVNY